MKKLRELYLEHVGKVSDKWEIYLNEYDRVFSPYREQEIDLLEIGVQNGGSLEVWEKYFNNARSLIGCDIDKSCENLEYYSEKISIVVGNANSGEAEKSIISKSEFFDIIIDDGSHTSQDIIESFDRYFKHLKNGGVYVVEDLHCSYWESYGGGLYDQGSSIAFFKQLVDVVNYEHWGLEKPINDVLSVFNEKYSVTFSTYCLTSIHSVEFFNSACVIRKEEPSLNRLGKRNVVGQDAVVMKGVLSISGELSYAPKQDCLGYNAIHPHRKLAFKDAELSDLKDAFLKAQEKNEFLERAGVILEQQNNGLKNEIQKVYKENEALLKRVEYESTKVELVLSSKSWRVTKPLRSFSHLIKTINDSLSYRESNRRWSFVKVYVKKITPARIFGLYNREGIKGFEVRFVHLLSLLKRGYLDSAYQGKPDPIGRSKYFGSVLDIDLSSYDVVSFDVFDTALVRLTQEPIDVFDFVGGFLKTKDFKQRRVKAEKEARDKLVEQKDIEITDIYDKLSNISPEHEIMFENILCKANPELYLIYCMALNAHKEIYFVSDVYLPRKVVSSLLDRNGYSARDGLLVSSDDDLIKGDGSRYEALLNNQFKNKKVLHIGDNYIADYEQAKRFGISAFHYAPSDEFFKLDPFVGAQIEYLKEHKTSGISLILGFYRYWMLGFRHDEPSFWRKVGFLYGGALIYQFVHFMHQKASEHSSNPKIFFLARDGYIIKKVYESVFGDEAIECHYMWASRRCMTFPLLKGLPATVSDDVLFLYTMAQGNITTRDVMERFGGYKLPGLEHSLVEKEKNNGSLTESLIKSAMLENMNEVTAMAQSEYDNLRGYLESIGYFGSDSILVDVGWSGTIQDCLTTMFSAMSEESSPIGVYLGVRPGVNHSSSKLGFVFDDDPSQYARFNVYLEFIELLTSSPEDGVVNVSKSSNGGFQPKRWEPTKEEEDRKCVSKEIQAGIIDYAKLARSFEKEGLDLATIKPDDFLTLFESLRTSASEMTVGEFGKLAHSIMISGPHTTSILNFDAG